jgi:glycosyltransferase involved in cell wall biosynthesis
VPPDHVHIVTEGPLGASALRAARALGLSTTSGFHTNFHSYSRHYGLGRLAGLGLAYLRRFHNATGGTMVPTAQIEALLRSQGFERLRVVSRGVDASAFNPRHRAEALRASWGASPSDQVALYVGRLAPEKNPLLAFRAFMQLRERVSSARLVVVGDGPMRPELTRAYPGVTFTGALSGAPLSAHYASADLFLFPSLTETFGNVTLEAMASGLAVIAFDDAAARLYINHLHNGILVPPGSEEGFLAGASLLGQNVGLTRRLGAAAVARARQADWAAVAAAFLEFLGSVPLRPTRERESARPAAAESLR